MGQLSDRTLMMTGSDIELMVKKIEQLGGASQDMLKLAAAIGNIFSVTTLSCVMGVGNNLLATTCSSPSQQFGWFESLFKSSKAHNNTMLEISFSKNNNYH